MSSWENGLFVNVYVGLSVLHVVYICSFQNDLDLLLKFVICNDTVGVSPLVRTFLNTLNSRQPSNTVQNP